MDMSTTRETELLQNFAPLGIPLDKRTPSNYALLINEEYLTGS